MSAENELATLSATVIHCTKCVRLVNWREQVAREKVRRFTEDNYWGRPVPGFGDPHAGLLIVGLAPAAHGANRTGRIFTGDRSGDWLYRSLHKFGFANQPVATGKDDGLRLHDCFISAALRCAPPQNKPTAEEKNNCLPYLAQEFNLLARVSVIVALGRIAYDTIFRVYREVGQRSRPKDATFGHNAELLLHNGVTLIASFHPSQQNTFTGRLTEPMFDSVFARARQLLEQSRPDLV